MLHIEYINKYYDDFQALKDVSLEVKTSRVFCLLGPNGSGKSTLINCFLSLLKYKTGQFKFECNTSNPRKKIGVIMEDEGFCRDMSVYKNLALTSIIKESPFSEIDGLIELVGLTEHRNKQVRKLSQGMKKRLSIANSLIGNPDFLVWDEPYNALDPDGFIFIRNLIAKLNKEGKTFFLCTHLLDEVQRVADDIGLIYKGKILSSMSKKDIIENFGTVENFYLHYTSVK